MVPLILLGLLCMKLLCTWLGLVWSDFMEFTFSDFGVFSHQGSNSESVRFQVGAVDARGPEKFRDRRAAVAHGLSETQSELSH